MELPVISIIIVNYNGKKWLDKCLTSLSNQNYPHLEIVLVDNASVDESVAFVKNSFPGVKLIQSDCNSGFAGGNNIGVAHATGKYILLLNSDTWIEPTFISDLYQFLLESKVDIVGPREARYDKQSVGYYFSRIDCFGHPVNTYGRPPQEGEDFYLSGVCLLMEKSTYRQIGGLEELFFMYSEEVDFFWRGIQQGLTFKMNPELEVYHAGAGSSSKGKALNIFTHSMRNRNVPIMLYRNYQWFNLLWVFPVYWLMSIFEAIIFALFGQIQIALSYPKSVWYFIKHFRYIHKSRNMVQLERKVSDRVVMKRMYPGIGKFAHLYVFLKRRIKF